MVDADGDGFKDVLTLHACLTGLPPLTMAFSIARNIAGTTFAVEYTVEKPTLMTYRPLVLLPPTATSAVNVAFTAAGSGLGVIEVLHSPWRTNFVEYAGTAGINLAHRPANASTVELVSGSSLGAINLLPDRRCPRAICPADCDEDFALTVFDFVCFQAEYAAATVYADCNRDGVWNVFDFICFGNKHAAGCP